MKIKIGTRGSNLALTQTNMVANSIKEKFPQVEVEIIIIKTTGDIKRDVPIGQIGGKEIFVKEIEFALLNKDIDLAVHSMKDMPGELPKGLRLSATPKREDCRDVLVLKENGTLDTLKQGAKIATGSKRRGFQLKALRPDLEILPIRGNVETRIEKIESENLDGVVLAAAGIHRLNLKPENMLYLDIEDFLPSPTQGILALEIREDDEVLHNMLMELNDEITFIQAQNEREFLKAVGGSCKVPVGAYCHVEENKITLKGLLGSEDGNQLIKMEILGRKDENLGKILGEKMLKILLSKVYLVGAGPGDEDLITLKGKRCIKEADVIIYDRLANKNLLNYTREDAELIYAGKISANHTMTQDEINELLFDKAKEGKIVTRLKGGDPYVFGRGGEEFEYLKDRGVKVEVVPGITSAIGGLAYAGIPITHRGVATSFHVITGHTQDDDELDYKTLSKLQGTLVFLMGLKNLEKISQGLLDNGREKPTPVAVINWGTMSKQKTVVGNLENISKLARNEKLKSPCLIVVGEVVNLRNKLNFFEEMPLFGENIVLTREVKNVHSTKEKFHRLGANVITLPMIETVELETQREIFDNINNYDYIFFTSVNGVNYFFKQFLKSYDIRDLKDIKFCALGIKTKKAIENFGIKVDIMPENYAGEDGVKALEKVLKKTDKLLVPRAKMGRPEIIDSLKDLAEITEIQIYDTKSLSAEIEETLEEYERYSLVFTSASTFNNFYKGIKDRNRIFSRAKIISIGPITSIAIKKAGLNVDIEAKEYTIEGIIEGILEEKNV
ncbi:MAG: hydroxymethylbilane synthase [Tissierellia bacterium]|nr:hydroxymethylbilane synthase [Tissierellia bacterium]